MMSEKVAKNYRMSRRVPVYFPASFEFGSANGDGMVLQISDGGMLFCCPKEIDIRTKGVFNLKAFDNEPDVTLDGEVVHRLYEREPSNDEGLIKYGVRFLDPEDTQREVISRVIRFATIRERYFTKSPSDSA